MNSVVTVFLINKTLKTKSMAMGVVKRTKRSLASRTLNISQAFQFHSGPTCQAMHELKWFDALSDHFDHGGLMRQTT